ncbi:MAG: hypothetical protein B7733_04570 [Myxococcales bacterium FL481]|nr:MAG: hypothetical protein B7733_04570 [Myxococcales bacterium FL481]
MRALAKLARDVVDAVVLELPEAEALVLSQRLDNARPRTALEDGWMLRVLLDEHGLSQQELADKLDRSTSWVSRRLGLVRALPESVQRVVRKGRLPVQAATKYLVPLARANAAQCEQLVRGLGRGRVSVRQVKRLYDAWRQGDVQQRARLAEKPRLFLRAQDEALKAARARERETAGVELVIADLGALAGISLRVCKRLAALRSAWMRARGAFSSLTAHLTEENDHAGSRDEDDDPQAVPGRPRGQNDRAGAQGVAQLRAACHS